MQGIIRSFILLLASGIVVCGMPAFAALPSQKSIQSELASSKETAQVLSKKSTALGNEIKALKKKLISTSLKIRGTEEKISLTEEKLKELHEQKLQNLSYLYTDQKSIGGFVSAAGKLNRQPDAYAMLQASPLQIAHTHLLMKSILPALNARTNLTRSRIDELARIEDAIQASRKKKTEEFMDLKKEEEKLHNLVDQRNGFYKKTESDRKQQEQRIEKLAKEAKNLEELVRKIQLNSKDKSAKNMPRDVILPVHGTLKTAFGAVDDLGAKSKGMTFNTKPAATVVTPLSGTVRFAGPFQKHRQILIIEHQGGYHSLVAGLGHIDTVVGASLAAGEPVGTSETASSGAEIYYELRHKGEAVNPQKLSIAQRQQGKS